MHAFNFHRIFFTRLWQVALIGFLGVLWFSSLSVRRKEVGVQQLVEDDSAHEETESDSLSPLPSTPPRKKDPPVAGSIATPQGRRSARLIAKKKD